MDHQAKKIGTVKGLGDIYEVVAPLDRQLLAFAKEGIHTLAAPDEVAQVYIAGLSHDSSRTNMAPIAIKGGKTILVRNSPLMNLLMASAAVKAHAEIRYLEKSKDIYDTLHSFLASPTRF